MTTIGVQTSPAMHRRLKDGFNTLANLLAVTLGPAGRNVLIENSATAKPELFGDGATIARRMIEVPGRTRNIGLMMMRNLIWETHLQTGDGTALAAVLAQAIYNEAYKLRAAGANVMDLRRGIERATEVVCAALYECARPVTSEAELTQLAMTITGEPKLSRILGEMFDILGADAHITIENYLTPTVEREYHQGGHWKGRLASPHFVSEPGSKRAILADCRIVLFDGVLSDVEDVRALLEAAAQVTPPRVAVVARAIRGAALNTLVMAQGSKKVEIIAAELQEVGRDASDDLEDLAALTGAKLFSVEAGYPLSKLQAPDFGRAMRVEADQKSLVVVGSFAHAPSVRERIALLQARRERLVEKHLDGADVLNMRIARLSGSAGTLKIGALTEPERDILKQKAEKCLRVLPSALRHGMLPGGGVAYLNCIARLNALDACDEEAWGIKLIARALEATFKRIVANAGGSAPSAILPEARRSGDCFGFDALSGRVVDLTQAGIWDAAEVLATAFRSAASGAMMALTIDAVVLNSRPPSSTEP
jgi:chaperonin GroEL